jgi:hypothetical protein
MEADELAEVAEKAHGSFGRIVGLTMAIFAAMLALVTLMGHRLHTEEVVTQTKAVDDWAYYQAKNSRYHMYAADAQIATLIGPQGAATSVEWARKAQEEKDQSEEVRKEGEALDRETQAVARRATFFDAAEISFEVAIVLCSVTLLTTQRPFWLASFVCAAAGIVLAAVGMR